MKLNREILRLAVPSILAGITVPLVGMVDLAVVGHLDGEGGFSAATALGGIAIGTTIFDLVYWCFGFLRAGTGGVTAQAFGRGDAHSQAQALARSLGIALVAGLALVALQWVIVTVAFLFIKCTPEVEQLAKQYFYIRIWAAPATISLFALKGWFIGMQNSVHSMAADLIVNAVNIAASVLLGFGIWVFPRMGFNGVAAGTVIAQWTGFLFALAVVALRYRKVFSGFDARGTFKGGLRQFFSMNADLFVRSLGLIAVYVGFTVISARYGDLMPVLREELGDERLNWKDISRLPADTRGALVERLPGTLERTCNSFVLPLARADALDPEDFLLRLEGELREIAEDLRFMDGRVLPEEAAAYQEMSEHLLVDRWRRIVEQQQEG